MVSAGRAAKELSEPVVIDVLLPLIAEERYGILDLIPIAQFSRSDQVRTGRGSDEDAVLTCQPAHLPHGVFGLDRNDLIQEGSMALNNAGYKPIGDPLYQVLPDLAAENRARLARLKSDNPARRVDCLERLTYADDGAAGTNAADDHIREHARR